MRRLGIRAIHESPLQADLRRSILSKAIGYLKMNSCRDVHRFRPEESLWQRSCCGHVVRNEDDYREIAEYVDANPARWEEDLFFRA